MALRTLLRQVLPIREQRPEARDVAPADAEAVASERARRRQIEAGLADRRRELALAEWRLRGYQDPLRRARLREASRRAPWAAILRRRHSSREVAAVGAVRGGARSVDAGSRATPRAIRSPSICIVIGSRDWDAARVSGDLQLAEMLRRALSARGCAAVVHLVREQDEVVAGFDVALHMRGRGRRRPSSGQLNCIWVMSHPAEVTVEEVSEFDLVLAASETYARRLGGAIGRTVHVLEQFTDPDLFHPCPDPGARHEMLFVGNWRSVYRRAVWTARRAGFSPALYGAGWRLLAPDCLVREHVPHEELPALYSSAGIVLNDHWDDMRAEGFVSNRVFDALACGAFVLSDDNPGLRMAFDGGVETFRDGDEFKAKALRYLEDPELRASVGARGRDAVTAKHTADHRAGRLLDLLADAAV